MTKIEWKPINPTLGKIELEVPGPPKGKDRPRSIPGQVRPFTPAETKRAEKAIVTSWLENELGVPEEEDYFNGAEVTKVRVPIKATVVLLVPRNDGHFLGNGFLNTEGQRHPQPEGKKPDVDNAIKLVMDALNKRAYKDDVKIVTLEVKRRWSRSREGTYIVIEPEYENGDWD